MDLDVWETERRGDVVILRFTGQEHDEMVTLAYELNRGEAEAIGISLIAAADLH